MKDPKQTIALWQADPERSVTAQLGSRMLNGEWVSADDAREAGVNVTVIGQIKTIIKAAGYRVLEKPMGAYGLRAYRVKPGTPQSKRIDREHAGTTHPQLGVTLTVRALALDETGDLVMSLSNGTTAWMVKVVGQVAQ